MHSLCSAKASVSFNGCPLIAFLSKGLMQLSSQSCHHKKGTFFFETGSSDMISHAQDGLLFLLKQSSCGYIIHHTCFSSSVLRHSSDVNVSVMFMYFVLWILNQKYASYK